MKMFRVLLLVLAIYSPLLAQKKASTFGEQRTLVVIANDPSLLGPAQEAFFGTSWGSLDSFYQDSSYGLTWFTGDIYLATFSMPSTCDVLAVKASADAAAVSQGANMDAYTRHIYVVPGISCSWSGFSTWGPGYTTPNGTTYSAVWLRGLGPWNHEMGHSFGLSHAGTLNPYYDRGDPTDVMGVATRQFNGPHKEDLGWVTAQTVTADGTYFVTPLELTGGSPLLKIPKPDTAAFYYVSYRQPVGPYDGSFSPTLTAGVSIHVWRHVQWNDDTTWPADPNAWVTRLVDTTPGTSSGFLDAPLVDGSSFYDSTNKIKITQVGHTDAGAGITVEFGVGPPPPPGPNTPPVVTISSPPSGAVYTCPKRVQFSGAVIDAEDGNISSTLVWTDGGSTLGTGATISYNYGCGAVGSHTVTATAKDKQGGVGAASVGFAIRRK